MQVFVENFLQALVAGLLIGSIYGLMCVGLGLIFGVMRVINFAQGDFLMLGMYVTLYVVDRSRRDARVRTVRRTVRRRAARRAGRCSSAAICCIAIWSRASPACARSARKAKAITRSSS